MKSDKIKILNKIKLPKKKNFREMQNFFFKRKINIQKNHKFVVREDYELNNNTYGPEIEDLFRIYNIIF